MTTHYHAAALLLEALAEIGEVEMGKALALLTPHLRVPSSFQPSISSLSVFERTALVQVQRSVRLLATTAVPVDVKGSDMVQPAEVYLTLRPSLPSALQLLGVFKSSVPYVRALSVHLSNPEALALSTDLFPSSDAKDPLPATDEKTLEKVHTLLSIITVVIEGMISFEYGEELTKMVAALLAVHWELSQLVAATGIERPRQLGSVGPLGQHHRRRGPMPWSVDTCIRLCRMMTNSTASDGVGGSTSLLLYPPSLVAHGMGIVKEALSGKEYKVDTAILRDTLLRIQEACYIGLFRPYSSSSLDGAVSQVSSFALGLARRLHAIITGGFRKSGGLDIMQSTKSVTQIKKEISHAMQVGGTAADFQVRKRKKQSDAADKEKQKAVEDFMKIFKNDTEIDSETETSQARKQVVEQGEAIKIQANGHTTARRIVPIPIEQNVHAAQHAAPCPKQSSEPQPANGPTGRVVMRPSLGMDQAEREAMWTAYIRDKDRLVEMLGDSSYREWYDESSHPVHRIKRKFKSKKGKSDMEAAFDAVFGRTAASASELQCRVVDSYSPSLLYLSTILPWQAALTASVSAMCLTEPGQSLASLTTKQQRRDAATTALKILEPVYSRNSWVSASKLAETYVAGGAALHFAVQLVTLCNRAGRHTAAPTLEAYTSLLYAICSCQAALEEQSDFQRALSAREVSYFPYTLVARLLRTVFRFPPLLSSSVTPSCAATMPLLTTIGMPSDGTVQYLTALLWLAAHPAAQSAGGAGGGLNNPVPAWVSQQVSTPSIHPLAVGHPSLKRTAMVELVKILLERCQKELEALDIEVLFPLAQACVTLALTLPSPAVDLSSTEALVSFLSGHLELMATELAGILESSMEATSDSEKEGDDLLEVRGRLLGLGLEFFDALIPQACQAGVLSSCLKVLESGYSPHKRCIAALRRADQGSVTCRSVTQGVDAAPLLSMVQETEGEEEEASLLDGEKGENIDSDNESDSDSDDKKRAAGSRKKRIKDIRNPYLRAIMAEGRRGDGVTDADLSDLEDFIVANPSRDYEEFITNHFPMPESDQESETDSESG